jgi:hypothetical protein
MITYEEYMAGRKPKSKADPNKTFEEYMAGRNLPISGEPVPRVADVSPQEEKKQIEDIVDWSDAYELPVLSMEQLYEPVSHLVKSVPDPKDVYIKGVEIELPARLEKGKEEEGVLKTLLGFRYPPKPPGWKYASPIERFNFITLPISDILGRIGGKIASDWRMMKKEDVQKLLVNELDEDLKWYQKTPEAVGWTAEKIAEYLALKGIFKASGLHRALTTTGQKAAAPFIAKEITKAGGLQSVKTLSGAGIKNLLRKGVTSFLTAAPENTAFISSWSALDAFMKGGDIKEEAISGAKWGLVLTGVFSAVAPLTQVPEMRLAFQKAIANVGKRFPGMFDKLGKPVTEEVEKEWLKAISKSRGKDLRLIDLTVRERQMFRNAIRVAEKEILKHAEREAAIQAYWGAKAAKVAQPTKPATKEITKVIVEKPVVPAKPIVAKPPAAPTAKAVPEPTLREPSVIKEAAPTAEKVIDKQQLESDEMALSDKQVKDIDMMPKGIVAVPGVSAARDTLNRMHDYLFTFGQAKREDPALYDELMKAYGKRNAGVERAIDQIGRITPKEIKIDDDVNMAMVYEDKRLSPKPEQKEAYDKFKALLDEMSKKQKEEGLYARPFNERLIEEISIQIEKYIPKVMHPDKSKKIKRMRKEIENLRQMRYLPHSIVAKRTIESKVNTLSGEKRTAYLQRLSAFYKKRTGKVFLKDYLDAGLITKDDMRMSRLATEEVADYYIRSAYKGLYDYGKAKEYIRPFSEELHDEGWLTAKELGISSLELKDQIVHPLFGSALAEMKAMRTGRGSYISQLFGAVKVGQFIKPTIVWIYDAVQHYMRGMYSFNPVTEAKAMNTAVRTVLDKDELYHTLNESNLYQFPYEVSRAHRSEEIAKFINQHSAEIDKVTKALEKTFDTRWLDPDTTLGDMVKKIAVAAHRGIAQVTWTGDKIQRTQSYLILRKMGTPHDEAVKVASSGHGGYSLLSEKYKAKASKVFFVYSFRFLMPLEMAKTISEPIKAAKDAMGGEKIPKHQWERMVKAVVGTAMIPIVIDEYMDWRGFEKEGKHLGPLAWKWSKTVTVDGEKREIVVGMNNILNMPVKYWNRIAQYNPIDKTSRGLQIVKNLAKWEVHPIYRIWFWDIADNRRSFGSGVSVYDTEANPAIQFAQIAKYIIGQSFRFFGHTMDAVGEGDMTDKERAEQEKVFDSALNGADKLLFWALGYKYIRQPIEERRAIMHKSLEKELTSRFYENARKYEGEELEKRKRGLERWARKCENWIDNEMK